MCLALCSMSELSADSQHNYEYRQQTILYYCFKVWVEIQLQADTTAQIARYEHQATHLVLMLIALPVVQLLTMSDDVDSKPTAKVKYDYFPTSG